MSAKTFSEDHRVVYYETNVTGVIGIGRLVDLMILVSGDQSDSLGVTDQRLSELGLGWVVTQHVMDITRQPRANEVVTISTKAQEYNRFFCYRDFWVTDQEGQQLVKMHSVFVLMDRTKRKIVRLPQEIIAPYESEYTKKIERLAAPQPVNDATASKKYRVRFMDIDGNHHVNNVHYFDWMLDALPADFLLNHRLTKMNIQYRQEVYYGATVSSQVELDQDELITKHVITTEDEKNCNAECHWEKISD